MLLLALWSPSLLAAVPKHAGSASEAILRAAHIGTDNASLLHYFHERSGRKVDTAQVKRWIEELGDDSFFVREKASARLAALGNAAAPWLREALQSDDPEVVHRARKCLQQLTSGTGVRVPVAAARLLRLRHVAGATAVLLEYLPSAQNDDVIAEVKKTLTALARRPGKPDAALMQALSASSPVRRATAAEVLSDANVAEAAPIVHRLLKDTDAQVRMAAGLVLARRGERDAVPVLIDLLAEVPPNRAWKVEDFLFHLGGENSPDVTLGTDLDSRQAARTAWSDWWKEQGRQVDLGKLHRPPPLLGYTMIVLLDRHQLLELDKDKQPRWQISGLELPLDAQKLPGPRVLVAEHDANRVTERSTKTGEVRWEYKVADPLMAQRLPNGHTFVASSTLADGRVVEVDHAGNEVFAHDFSSQLLRAAKLTDGGFACILRSGASIRYVRFNADGEEEAAFAVDVRTSGGRIDVLSNGHALIPELNSDRVVEYTATGAETWQASVRQPVAAVRLRDGHTLVTSMTAPYRAIELDKAGKEVWEYKSDTRVTRAWRR